MAGQGFAQPSAHASEPVKGGCQKLPVMPPSNEGHESEEESLTWVYTEPDVMSMTLKAYIFGKKNHVTSPAIAHAAASPPV
jgi:hypothetical protein